MCGGKEQDGASDAAQDVELDDYCDSVDDAIVTDKILSSVVFEVF